MKKIFPHSISQSFLMLLIFLICGVPVLYFVKYYFNDVYSETALNFILIPTGIIGIAVIHLINKKRNFNYDFKLKRIELLPYLAIIVILFQLSFATPISKIIIAIEYPNTIPVSPFASISSIIGLVFLAPIFEEIIFRNYILKGMLTAYSPKKAIIASGLIFGLAHIYPDKLLGVIILGLFFGLIYYKTRSIGITIILHSIANLTAVFTAYAHYKYGNHKLLSTSTIYGDYSIYIISISFLFLIFFSRKLILKLNVIN